jgi:hypothetical protein
VAYEYHHLIRTRPDNGSATTYDLRDEFSDASGPVATRPTYKHEADDWEDVNRVLRQRDYGFRATVALTFDIATVADHAALATIVTALARSDFAVDLSLDNGTTWREVRMKKAPSPRPWRGKTTGGARYQLLLECVDLLASMPAQNATGGW